MRFTHELSESDIIDITLETDGKGKIVHFVINYRARFEEATPEWREVYRIDTCHDFLHEQRFWQSPEPIPLKGKIENLKAVFDEAFSRLKEEYHRYKHLYRKRMKGMIKPRKIKRRK